MILTKSRYTKGLQCPKLLWLTLHEPNAPELATDPQTKARFSAGTKVGEAARNYVEGGALIERIEGDFLAPIKATEAAIENGAKVLYEAAFLAENIYCAVDILEKQRRNWTLVEVKSSTKVKEQHLPDVALQVYVARQCGLPIKRTEVMVLNSACRFPDLRDLFVRHDVTDEVEDLVMDVEDQANVLLEVINQKSQPTVAVGDHCHQPYECPFLARCHRALPEHHVSTLYFTSRNAATRLVAGGYSLIAELDDRVKLGAIQKRQVESVRTMQTVVEPELKKELNKLKKPIAYLDFETVAPAIPLWDGCGPYKAVPAQFSCHVESGKAHKHFEWIASCPGDPRRPLAEALIVACRGAKTILAYNASFEKSCIKHLADHLPDLADELVDINDRIRDLLPIVRNHVYHPEFQGSFSIKKVLPALVPDLSYEGLAVAEGGTASMLLEMIVSGSHEIPADVLEQHIIDLKEYCRLDTWAMVELVRVLKKTG